MRKTLKIFTFSAVFIMTLTSAEEGVCRLDVPFRNTCDPYGVKLLSFDKINYTNDRTSLQELEKERKDRRRASLFSLSYWLDRYASDAPPVRFRGTAEALSRAINVLKERVTGASKHIGKEKTSSLGKLSDLLSKSWGYYKVEPGDTIARIAKIFGVKQKDILAYNRMKATDILRVGQKLILPVAQEKIDVMTTGRYRVKKGDSLISVAKRFGLDANEIARANRIKRSNDFYIGRVLTLPFDHIKKRKWLQNAGRRKLRVTATAYTSHRGQTDDTPFLAAWNNRLKPGMKVIAVSRDLIAKYGLTNGTKVKISGLPGYYTVRDKMNKRYRRRIDIYMGTDRRRALRWGRRSVVIYF